MSEALGTGHGIAAPEDEEAEVKHSKKTDNVLEIDKVLAPMESGHALTSPTDAGPCTTATKEADQEEVAP
jgi:hypothetical protein